MTPQRIGGIGRQDRRRERRDRVAHPRLAQKHPRPGIARAAYRDPVEALERWHVVGREAVESRGELELHDAARGGKVFREIDLAEAPRRKGLDPGRQVPQRFGGPRR